MLTRLNAVLFRTLVAILPASAFVYKPYSDERIGYEGSLSLKSSGRCVAFLERDGGLMYNWCDYNWFSL